MKKIKTSLFAAALMLGACSQGDSGQLEQLKTNGTQLNGMQLNGMQLNGMQLNGTQLNGVQLNGMQLNGTQLNGVQLNGVQLNGMQLSGTELSAYKNGDPNQVISGLDMVGTIMNMTLNPGNHQILVKIDAMYPDATSPASDVYLYDVSYQEAGSSTWTSVCTDANGVAVPGIPIANYWNMTTGARIDSPGTITFACGNGALGKCVRWGYRPWATGTQCTGGNCTAVSLKDHHQACTRMVRADYCGNGQANTLTGTPIDVYDGLSPQIQSPSTVWKVEAKWTPSGATCLGNSRGADLISRFKYPDCNGNHKNDDMPKCVDNDYSVQSPALLGNNYNG